MNTFDKDYWGGRWERGETGWDIGQASSPLVSFAEQIADKNKRILIPGCGSAWEGYALWKAGFKYVYLLDIVEEPLKRFHEKCPDFPADQLLCLDFFQKELDSYGPFDLILEQTFFCALDPSLRAAYVQRMHALLAPKGQLAGLLFNKDFGNPHPPFGGNETEYRPLFSAYFSIKEMHPCMNSIPQRQGTELFFCCEKSGA
jgi:thiopurine S-methyltransferase